MSKLTKRLAITISTIAIVLTLIVGVVPNYIDPPNPPKASELAVDPPNPPKSIGL